MKMITTRQVKASSSWDSYTGKRHPTDQDKDGQCLKRWKSMDKKNREPHRMVRLSDLTLVMCGTYYVYAMAHYECCFVLPLLVGHNGTSQTHSFIKNKLILNVCIIKISITSSWEYTRLIYKKDESTFYDHLVKSKLYYIVWECICRYVVSISRDEIWV